jgi:hypothetical protein
MSEELNEAHELVIAGAEFSLPTERIVNYLASPHKVKINAVFFRPYGTLNRNNGFDVGLDSSTQQAPETASKRKLLSKTASVDAFLLPCRQLTDL